MASVEAVEPVAGEWDTILVRSGVPVSGVLS